MKKLCAGFLLLLALAQASALAAVPAMTVEQYPMVDGSTATLPLSYALMSAVTGASEEEAKDAIRHSKTTESFYALVEGISDLLLVYAPSDDAFAYAKDQSVALEMKPIGRDALVFLVNEKNPVTSLSHAQLVKIYTGECENWSRVGGDDRAITAYQRIENSGSQVMMKAQVMRGTPMAEAPKELRPSEMYELVDIVASYADQPGAIGYSVYYYIHNMYMNQALKLLAVDGVAPTNATIGAGKYPFAQDFYAVIREDAPEDSPERKLYDFLSEEEGVKLLEQAGYVPIL